MIVNCSYCHQPASLVGGQVLYPHRTDLYHLQFYQCIECDAHVGCHPGTTKPLGRLANAELRQAKRATHAVFDPLWKNGPWSRSHAYRWLAKQLHIATRECHIGMFDVQTCQRVIVVCKGKLC